MIRQFELVDKVRAYDPSVDEDLLNKAYVFAMKAHGTQTRASGDPYFSHPLEVAGILCDMRLDSATIATALLHDTIEDTGATLDEIRALFGDEIASLVNGVTKLSQLELQSDKTRQAENFRKLVLAMSNDIRVLLVKLADRLHNMRTLHFFSSDDKKKRIARETLEIYAPLSERIGIHHFKDELEDISFQILNPDARESVLSRLRFLEQEGGKKVVEEIIAELKTVFAASDMSVHVSGRVKTPYSIWRKMHHKNITFEQLSDIMAFRVQVSDIGQCYQALGIIHSHYLMIPGRFKDYISTPKANNYQSLHTSIIGPQKQRIEIQIRTDEMHAISEYGVAAHWQYKQKTKDNQEQSQYRWLRSLLEILEHASGPEEFLEHTKLEMFQDQVFCFTPAGDLISLSSGATLVDFAYAIHSEVGNRCVGAKINGRMSPLRTVLKNGDQVEITTSKAQTPSPTWERFVVTGKARANIRRFIRTQQRGQFINLGQSILHKAFDHEHLAYVEKKITAILSQFKAASLDDLFAQVGEGQHSAYDVIRLVYPGYKDKKKTDSDNLFIDIPSLNKEKEKHKTKSSHAVSIKGLIPGMAVHYARCCHPLPGDRIVGIVITGSGVTIHTTDCENLNHYTNEPERWIDVSWDGGGGTDSYVARLNAVVTNTPGSLATLTTIISKHQANIVNLKIVNRDESYFEFMLDIEVRSVEHLNTIKAALRSSSLVQSITRPNT